MGVVTIFPKVRPWQRKNVILSLEQVGEGMIIEAVKTMIFYKVRFKVLKVFKKSLRVIEVSQRNIPKKKAVPDTLRFADYDVSTIFNYLRRV